MPRSHQFYRPITWMYAEGLSTGIKSAAGVRYAPKDGVSREAMAVFLYRMEGATYRGPARSPFVDVRPGDKFYDEIAWMYAEGLSTGIKQASGKPKYAPKATVSREAMAAFIYRLEGARAGVPAVSPFADLRRGDPFYREIAWMYAEGLSTGIKQKSGKPKYAPKARVSREAMAAFLYRLAGEPAVIDSGSLTIAGTPAVGETVTAQTDGWQPEGVLFTYQWFLDGASIAGAIGRSLVLDASAEGKRVQVRVRASVPGAVAVSMTSPPSLVAPKQLDPTPGTRPTISGTAQVGKTVTVRLGSWAVPPSVSWLIDGKTVGTGASLVLAPEHGGKTLAVRATAQAPGYVATTLQSSPVTVALGKITGTKPKIVGSIRAAETVSVDAGAWSVQPKTYWVPNLQKALDTGGSLDPDDEDFVGNLYRPSSTFTLWDEGTTITVIAVADAPGYGRLVMVSDTYTVLGLDTAAVEKEIHRLVNEYRVSQGLQAMVWDDRLALGARTWVQQLNATETFTHSTTEWRKQYASTTWGTGENIGRFCGSGSSTVASAANGAVKRWIASSDHLRNITTSSWDTTGVGVDVRTFRDGLMCVTSSQIFENRP
ncbi:CAP domain-containing protein [Leucobacter massiliensis]|uniref:CAP and S-layer homology domain-containing protein n=1 Tax=Leucobacter massiliensis TaxID=1686285 RepID=UPI0015E33BCE|nr:CAP domain-containing protein [Leucobacter massiliensis]